LLGEFTILSEVKKKLTGLAPHRTAASTSPPSLVKMVLFDSILAPRATTIEPTACRFVKLPAKPEAMQKSAGIASNSRRLCRGPRIPIPVVNTYTSAAGLE
jgi:hypothetical protein